ncbi:MAG: glycoside hydrolase family 3 protein [Candidatus Zixiibacteriota bacterium]|nr:MAG: glycoside hydrolase family 3 protein [candidate division Zixibacteria bacterium]
MSELIKRIGQLFVIGFPEQKPSKAFLNFIGEENIGGVILFRSNCPTNQAIQRNIQSIRSYCRHGPPFIAVDQEGGRVCRIMGAPAEFAAPSYYGENMALDHFEEDFRRSALCLEGMGINVILGPVCDVYLNDLNECLRDRCFGRKCQQVIPFVRKAVEVMKKYGLLSCLKHFPGLGAAEVDPHVATSSVSYDELIWDQREKLPFAAGIEAGADMIMTTHVRVPAMDTAIVTGSTKIVTNLLRQCLAFDGPIMTDDLTMKGAECLGDIGQRTVSAFLAGHDLLLFGQDIEAAMEAYEYFKSAVARGEISAEHLAASLDRVTGIKFKLGKSAVF